MIVSYGSQNQAFASAEAAKSWVRRSTRAGQRPPLITADLTTQQFYQDVPPQQWRGAPGYQGRTVWPADVTAPQQVDTAPWLSSVARAALGAVGPPPSVMPEFALTSPQPDTRQPGVAWGSSAGYQGPTVWPADATNGQQTFDYTLQAYFRPSAPGYQGSTVGPADVTNGQQTIDYTLQGRVFPTAKGYQGRTVWPVDVTNGQVTFDYTLQGEAWPSAFTPPPPAVVIQPIAGAPQVVDLTQQAVWIAPSVAGWAPPVLRTLMGAPQAVDLTQQAVFVEAAGALLPTLLLQTLFGGPSQADYAALGGLAAGVSAVAEPAAMVGMPLMPAFAVGGPSQYDWKGWPPASVRSAVATPPVIAPPPTNIIVIIME